MSISGVVNIGASSAHARSLSLSHALSLYRLSPSLYIPVDVYLGWITIVRCTFLLDAKCLNLSNARSCTSNFWKPLDAPVVADIMN